jgi:hypothetical protein
MVDALRRSVICLSLVSMGALGLGIASEARAVSLGPVVTLTGVAGNGFTPPAPLELSAAQLAGLQQLSATVMIDGVKDVEKGPPLSEILTKANISGVASCENDELRYWIEASSATGQSVVVNAAEFDPEGANNLALLSIRENGKPLREPRLIMAADKTGARDIEDVDHVTIGRAAPQLPSQDGCTPAGFKPSVTVPVKGSVVINGDVPHPVTVSFAQLQALPQVKQTDTYTDHGEPKSRPEIGPTLWSVLVRADPTLASSSASNLRDYFELTSSEDGSAALVSYAEIAPVDNDTRMLLSVNEDGHTMLQQDTGPRLTAPSDVSGERYVYGVQVISVFQSPARG